MAGAGLEWGDLQTCLGLRSAEAKCCGKAGAAQTGGVEGEHRDLVRGYPV